MYVERIAEEVNEERAIAARTEEMGHVVMAELDYRRKGPAVSVTFILLVVVGLYEGPANRDVLEQDARCRKARWA